MIEPVQPFQARLLLPPGSILAGVLNWTIYG